MLQGKYTRKVVAATLLTILMTNTFAPAAFALTSGPTQPEATSFEPIDTTDMVSMQTGDFTYNVPLIEVPGPDGSYPLSLSYHAGVQPNEDASWVGLGWTLNPGAINRSVNGLPDDWWNITNSSRDYWSGDHVSNYSVGATIGEANSPWNVSFGLSFSQDTYKGFGVGYDLMVGKGVLNAGVSKSPYGDISPKLGLNLASYSALGMSFNAEVSTNFKSLDAGVSVGMSFGGDGLGKFSEMHESMASGGSQSGGSSISVGGYTGSVHGSKGSGIETSTWGFNLQEIQINTWLNVSLGFSKTRYWTDETTTTSAFGSLCSPGSGSAGPSVFDNYSELEDPDNGSNGGRNITNYPDPTVLQGGAYPDFDAYNVTGQGLGGSIRPYFYQGSLTGKNTKDASGNPIVSYFYRYNRAPSQFRFIGDFSNSFTQRTDGYADMSQDLTSTSSNVPFDTQPVYSNNDPRGYNVQNQLSQISLAGSRYINYEQGDLDVLPRNIMGNTGDYYKQNMIKGFSITNESGVTYHYNLPAYSFGEENYQEKIDRTTSGLYFNRATKPNGYAYTWYLTSITGADYVDRNNDKMVDDGDWGYWVNFEYGKWSAQYAWRNPSEGFQRDEDNRYQNCSMGYREVYYLNAIRTRTHALLFEKSVRNDAKGSSPDIFDKNSSGGHNTDYFYENGLFDANSTQSMKLDKIYLVNSSDADLVTPALGGNAAYQLPSGHIIHEQPANVLDKTDVDAYGRANLEAKAIRIIDFTYDNSLCPSTTNSYDLNNVAVKTGKLTLKNLSFRGKGGANLLPPTRFDYDLSPEEVKSASGTLFGALFTTPTPIFQVGDLLVSADGQQFCGVVSLISSVGGTTYYTLLNSMYTPSTAASVTLRTTKNPFYSKDAYDMWGMYKCDYNLNLLANNENMGRNTTALSSGSVDAWSLRKITTQLGDAVKINYASDTYHQVAMGNNYSLIMQQIAVVPGSNNSTITFQLPVFGSSTDAASLAQVGSVFPGVQLLCVAPYSGCGGCYFKSTATPGSLTITSINQTGITPIYTGSLSSPINVNNLQSISTGNLWVNPPVDYYGGGAPSPDFYGGGLRTASLTSIHGLDNTTSTTTYTYNNAAGASSGITTYLPATLEAFDETAARSNPNNGNFGNMDTWVYYYKSALYKNTSMLYPLAREIPPPGVMYQYVTVTDQVSNPDEPTARTVAGSTQYEFEVFRPNMVGRQEMNTPQQGTFGGWNQIARNWVMSKYTSGIGNVKRIVQYDAQGRALTETINHYLDEGLEHLSFKDFVAQYKTRLGQYQNQGYFLERYLEVKKIQNYNNPYSPPNNFGSTFDPSVAGNRGTLSAREELPCINTGQTMINYANGTRTSTKTLGFDFFSGAVTQSLETDAYGNNFMTETVPAYQHYPDMGMKFTAPGNLNMLTQTAETRVWKMDGATSTSNKLGLVSATVNLWSNTFAALDIDGSTHIQDGRTEPASPLPFPNGNVWRPQNTLNWLSTRQTSDGLTSDFSEYNWSPQSLNDGRWTRTASTSLYDVFSKELEAIDINGNYAATHMNYGSKKVILTGGPAKYYEMAYSGAEDAGLNQTNPGFIQAGAGTVSTVAGAAHTGAQGLQLNAGAKGFIYSVSASNLTAGRDYTASVWVKQASGSTGANVKLYYDFNGGTAVPSQVSSVTGGKTAGGWTLVNLSISGSSILAGSTLNVWCRNDGTGAAYVDDMRFQPLNATTTAYVYDAFSGELTHILDNNNLYTRFEYDAAGRLVRTYKEKLNTGSFSNGEFKTNQYQYNYSTPSVTNDPITNMPFTKNNCPPNAGYTGSSVLVSIPGGTYSSFLGKDDANRIARIYAQDYANLHGSCNCVPGFTYLANGVSGTGSVNVTGDLVNFDFNMTLTAAAASTSTSTFTLGFITGSCASPMAQRVVPIMYTYFNTFGNPVTARATVTFLGGQVQVIANGTPFPTNVDLHSTYSISSNLVYSTQQSRAFTKNNCTSPNQQGSSVTYTVPDYRYYGTTQTDANNKALADIAANGQNQANLSGVCLPTCSFIFSPVDIPSSISANIASNGGNYVFSFIFPVPRANYTGGTIGFITGGCTIPINLNTNVFDPNTGRTWHVTITPSGSSGTVTATLAQGSQPLSVGGPPIMISSAFPQ